MLKVIKGAIALKHTEYSDESYTHQSTVEFQISCTPEEKKRILDYCDRYLPSKKRSRWIISILLRSSYD